MVPAAAGIALGKDSMTSWCRVCLEAFAACLPAKDVALTKGLDHKSVLSHESTPGMTGNLKFNIMMMMTRNTGCYVLAW
jgi:hypothetical protein